MARAALRRRLTGPLPWRVARLAATRDETPTARTLVLDVPQWPGHLAGQHVDVRLTAADGYSTQRSYSIASASDGDRIELTIQLLPDGEVSPFLARDLAVGDPLELRGPVGGWFVWRPAQTEPVLLIGGGSGIVPLAAMVRTRRTTGGSKPFALVYSVRTPDDVYYGDELHRGDDPDLRTTVIYTRVAPEGSARPAGRIAAADLADVAAASVEPPTAYVCGPTGFVESVAATLVGLGLDEARIRTERFGPSGG